MVEPHHRTILLKRFIRQHNGYRHNIRLKLLINQSVTIPFIIAHLHRVNQDEIQIILIRTNAFTNIITAELYSIYQNRHLQNLVYEERPYGDPRLATFITWANRIKNQDELQSTRLPLRTRI